MKNLFVVGMLALLLIGCDKNNPTAASTTSTTASNVAFGETSMYKTVVATDSQLVVMEKDSVAHDSLHHGRMLGLLKNFLGLTDAQFDSVKIYGQILFGSLKEIRTLYHTGLISEDSAHVLVKIARDQFIASIRSILTVDQSAKLDAWLTIFWEDHDGEHEGDDDHGNHGGGGNGGDHGSGQEHHGGHH